MEGLGNDYVYVNCFREKVYDPEILARLVSDRHRGIGGDGLILIGSLRPGLILIWIYTMRMAAGQRCVEMA